MTKTLEELRSQVQHSVTASLELPPLTLDHDNIHLLQRRLDTLRHRVGKKTQLCTSLQAQLSGLVSERETTCPPESFFKTQNSAFPIDDKGEFSVAKLWTKRQKLEAEIETMGGKIDAEDLQTEQMSYLLQNSKEATKAACQKTDQLRYLQKRLLRRHDEIVTMHTRAENEYIHASHCALKASQSAAEHSARLQATLNHKRKIADSLQRDIETLSDSVARKQLHQQDTQIRIQKAAEMLAKIDQEHKESQNLQQKHTLNIEHAKHAFEQIQTFIGNSPDSKVNTEEIIAAFHGLQFQNNSLNQRFSGLSKQSNQLRLHCESLQSQLLSLQNSEQTSSFSLQPHPKFPTFNQMKDLLDRQDDQQGLEKRTRDLEGFTLAVVLNLQEIQRKMNTYLMFISGEIDGFPEEIMMVMMQQVEIVGGKYDKSRGKHMRPSRKNRERGSIVAISKNDETAALAKLKEELSQRFSRKFTEKMTVLAGDLLPLRSSAELFQQKNWLEAVSHWEKQTENSALTVEILRFLITEGNVSLQKKFTDVISTLNQLIQVIFTNHKELKSQIHSQEFATSQQKQQFIYEKSRLRSRAEGLPLSNIPEKLKEHISIDFDSKIKALVGSKTERVSRNESINESENGEKEEEINRENEEIALMMEERKLQRLGLSMAEKKGKRSSFVLEKIASLSTIRKTADLEKKLLEQVQGVEGKLKRIKSRERKLKRTPMLPALSRSASTFRLESS